ncbi:S41 family peptidase [Pedobacter insulae]|uniref:N-terminal domain of Peptidase_S41 n=1 Tax=Pedobacter insulae TaxID=414048 RepID=A0A1I3A1U0_9SPHI|nr:S41 family peptidase [Pedobacter insulae]SFH44053.1 N-terminal domain of Peptidase_S41 [Pedobacter insulae]
MMKSYFKMILLMLFVTIKNAAAQEKRVLQIKEKNAVITSIKMHLAESYIDLGLSKEMITELDKYLKSGKYNKTTNPSEFSKTVTADLQCISKDLHLNVRFEPERIAQEKRAVSEEMKLETEKKMAMQMAEINYGFAEAKILDGNIGYLNLRMFADVKYAEQTATATMNFLSNTKAIIIDLRTNGGGVPNMMQLLVSYFFDEKPVLLSDFYERKTDTKTQLYSVENVAGKRSPNKPLYILTSKQTFSAAEAFAYTLRHLDKATVVGEVTKGGANRTKRISLNEEFTISVPYIQAIHPITKTNWEGKGVQPDIKTSEKAAFVNAYIDAINKTAKSNKNVLFNKIGYAFLKENSVYNAIEVFHENVKQFPNNANAWDSLGEAYFINNDKENALKSYQKAVELDPNLSSAKEMVQKLKSH